MKILYILFAIMFMVSIASAKGTNTYMIMSSHTKEECLQTLDQFKGKNEKMLNNCWFGCMTGDHTCYSVLKGKSENDVKMMLPENIRNKAKVVKVDKFTAKQIESFHNH